jgi:hypothetical protein
MSKNSTKGTGIITYQLPQPATARYLIVVSDRGIVSEVNHFTSLKEAKRAFGEIAHDYGYRPSEINASDKYDVSLWKWTEDRYEKFFIMHKLVKD